MIDSGSQVSTTTFLLEVAGVALVFRLLFFINEWFSTSINFSHHISWIFLPAVIRVLAVLLLGWRGVVGLLIGGLITNVPMYGWLSIDTYAYAMISAFGPLLAVELGYRMMRTKSDLNGLKAWQLFVFSLLGAFFNTTIQNIYFQFSGHLVSWEKSFMPMLVGDLAGTLIVLYLAAGLLRLLPLLGTKQAE